MNSIDHWTGRSRRRRHGRSGGGRHSSSAGEADGRGPSFAPEAIDPITEGSMRMFILATAHTPDQVGIRRIVVFHEAIAEAYAPRNHGNAFMLRPLNGGIDISRPLRYVSDGLKIAFKNPILADVRLRRDGAVASRVFKIQGMNHQHTYNSGIEFQENEILSINNPSTTPEFLLNWELRGYQVDVNGA